MNILIIGSGGREHALAFFLNKQGNRVFCAPGNAGTEEICLPHSIKKVNDFKALNDFVSSQKIDLTVVGPENFLADGIADAFAERGHALFGPSKRAAQLESSKAWAKGFMKKYDIPTARFVICRSLDEAYRAVDNNFSDWNGVVIKCSGLTGGKGVIVCSTLSEAHQAIEIVMKERRYGSAGNEIVVEEKLEGYELSLLAFADDTKMIPMIPSQDHKRLLDNDQGPNTGGIGAFAPVPFVDRILINQIREEIIDRTQAGLNKEGINYRGIVFFGLMITQYGPKVLEYNCRFGDPETQAILPLLESDLGEIMNACLQNRLKEEEIRWSPRYACCVVMVSGGYPNSFQTGYEIKGLNKLKDQPNSLVFHAGTSRNAKGDVVTSGGRVLGVTGLGNDLEQAIKESYQAVKKISFDQAHYRSDIARQALTIHEASC